MNELELLEQIINRLITIRDGLNSTSNINQRLGNDFLDICIEDYKDRLKLLQDLL